MQSAYDKIQYFRLGQKEKACVTAKIKALLAEEERVQSAWLFGSFTREGSIRDIDLAIHAEPELAFKEYLDLNARLELELRIPIDLVEITKAPSTLQENIRKKGIQIKHTRAQQLQHNERR